MTSHSSAGISLLKIRKRYARSFLSPFILWMSVFLFVRRPHLFGRTASLICISFWVSGRASWHKCNRRTKNHKNLFRIDDGPFEIMEWKHFYWRYSNVFRNTFYWFYGRENFPTQEKRDEAFFPIDLFHGREESSHSWQSFPGWVCFF